MKTTLFFLTLFVALSRGARAQTNSDPVVVYDNHLTEIAADSGTKTGKGKVEGYTIIDRAFTRSIQFMVYHFPSGIAFTVRTNGPLCTSVTGPGGKATRWVAQAYTPRAGTAATFCLRGESVSLLVNGQGFEGVKVFSVIGADVGSNAGEQWSGTLTLDQGWCSTTAARSDTVDSAATLFYSDLSAAYALMQDGVLWNM